MKIFTPNFKLSLQQCKLPDRLVGACRVVIKQPGQSYDVSRQENQTAELALISYASFQQAIANLDPTLSQPVLMKVINLPVTAAAIRFEELYHIATGDSEFPGTERSSNPGYIFKSGFEHKIIVEGTQNATEIETVAIAGGVAQVAHPVSGTAGVSAEDTSGSLQVGGSGTPADVVIQDLTYTSVVEAEAANNITITYLPLVPAIKAGLNFNGVTLQAVDAGAAGNSITIATTAGATFGAEVVTVSGTDISVQIAVGQTNAGIIAALINNDPDAQVLALASTTQPLNVVPVQAATNLIDGEDAIGTAGSEVVAVSGVDISVTMESGVSTATQIDTAITGSTDASALVTVAVSGTGSNPQIAQSQTRLANGLDADEANQLGQISLTNNGSPISDGTEVSVAYPSPSYTVYQIQCGKNQQAALVSKNLLAYLITNAS